MKGLRLDRQWKLGELASRLKQVGAATSWQRVNVLSDLEAGRRAIDLEDLEVLAKALNAPGHPCDVLDLVPWLGKRGLSSDERDRLAARMREAYMERQQAAIDSAIAALEAVIADGKFRQAIAQLAELPKGDREWIQDMVRYVRLGRTHDSVRTHLARPPAVVS